MKGAIQFTAWLHERAVNHAVSYGLDDQERGVCRVDVWKQDMPHVLESDVITQFYTNDHAWDIDVETLPAGIVTTYQFREGRSA